MVSHSGNFKMGNHWNLVSHSGNLFNFAFPFWRFLGNQLKIIFPQVGIHWTFWVFQLGEFCNVAVLLNNVAVSLHNVEKDTSSIECTIQTIDCNTATSLCIFTLVSPKILAARIQKNIQISQIWRRFCQCHWKLETLNG